MESIIWLKNGGIKYYTLPENSESYSILQQAQVYRGKNTKDLKYEDGKTYICLIIRAILKAPKYTKFRYDYSEKRYTRKQALDYVLGYDHTRNDDRRLKN